MNAQQLKNSILQLAVQGKLVPQDPNDEPASALIERIRAEKERLIKEKKIKPDKNPSYIFRGSDNLPYEKVGKNEPVCIAEEVPFDIPDSWEWVRLGNISIINGGYAFKSTDYTSDGTRVIRISDFNENGFVNKSIVRHKFDDALQDFLIEKGNIILCMTGGTVGKSYFVKEIPEPMMTNQRVATIKLLKAIEDYINLVVLSPITQKVIQDSKNSTNDNISMDTIKGFFIPLPPLQEQQRIVDKLKELEPYINDYDKAYEKIEKLNTDFPDLLKKSILQEAVQGKLVPQDPTEEPASVLMEQIRKEKEQLIKDKKIKKDKNESYIFRRDNSHYEKIGTEERCIDDEIPFDIPDSWVWTRLSNIVYNNGQKTPDKDFCYIDIGSINNQEQQLGINENIIKPENAPSRARKIVKYGDIIYSTVRPYLHNMCIIDKTFSMEPIASTGFAVMSCYKGIFNKFLFYYLLAPDFDNYANHTDNAKGVAYPAINDERLYNALIPVPPYQEQIRIVDKLEHLLPKIKDLK